ncbi:MAG: sigma-70 factor domain-containing protein, partial [Acidimicrobiia bacterium]
MSERTESEPQEDLVRLYLNEIGRYPLLTKSDEERLGRAVEEGQAAAGELAAAAARGTRVPAAHR